MRACRASTDPTHGVRQVGAPWAAPRSRVTLLLERLIIDLITQCRTVLRQQEQRTVLREQGTSPLTGRK